DYRGAPSAATHRGPLSQFPALSLATEIEVGDAIRVLGFGHKENADFVPYEWSGRGTVTRLSPAQDGTPLVVFTFDRSTRPGHSGARVLNPKAEVVEPHKWEIRS